MLCCAVLKQNKLSVLFWCGAGSSSNTRITLDSEHLGVSGLARKIAGHAGEVGVVLRPEVIDPQNGLVVANVRDADPAGQARLEHDVIPEPGEHHGEIAVRNRAEHGDPLAKTKVLAHAELVYCGRDCQFLVRKRDRKMGRGAK